MSEKNEYRIIAKNTVVLGSAQVVQMLVTLIRAKVIALLLGPIGAGVNSLILSALSVMQQVSSLGIYQSGVREMSVVKGYNDESKLAGFRKIFLRLSCICGVGGVFIMFLLSPLFSLLLFDNLQYTWWLAFMALALFFMALQSGYSVVMQATQNLGLMARATMTGAVGGLILVIPLFFLMGIYAIVPAIVIGYAAFYFSFRYFEHKIPFAQVKKVANSEFVAQSKPILKLGIVLMFSVLMTVILAFVLNLFINHWGSVEEVGIYQSAASIITQGMSIANIVLASDFFSRLSVVHTDSGQMRSIINKQVDILLYTIAPISILIIALAPFIVWFLLSPQFALVAGLLRIMSLALVFKVMWLIMSYIILAKGDKKGYFVFDALLGNGINFLIAVIGFYFGGLNGLALAYLAGAVFMVVLLWFVTKHRCGVTLMTRDLLKMGGLAIYISGAYFVTVCVKGILGNIVLGIVTVLLVGYSVIQLNKKMNFVEVMRNKLNI